MFTVSAKTAVLKKKATTAWSVTSRLSDLEASGIVRRSGRSTTGLT